MKVLMGVVYVTAGLAGLYLGLALALIFWPEPNYFKDHPITPEQLQAGEQLAGVDYSKDASIGQRTFLARDGIKIVGRNYGDPNAEDVFIFLHGVASGAAHLNNAATLLAENTNAYVITLDFRGHGFSGGKRYDVDYIGQYESDLSDIIAALNAERPNRRIFIAGHSMGGGVALRYALLQKAPHVAGYLLFAPNFGEGPTQPPPPPDNSEAAEFSNAFVAFNTNRLIGIIMLNMVGVHALDHMTIMYFNKPPDMPAYSYAAIASAQPNAPHATPEALQAIDAPLLVLVGENDEIFVAKNYQPIIDANSTGRTEVLPGLNHNGVLNDPAAYNIVRDWYENIE